MKFRGSICAKLILNQPRAVFDKTFFKNFLSEFCMELKILTTVKVDHPINIPVRRKFNVFSEKQLKDIKIILTS